MLDPKVCKSLLLKSETKFDEELLCRLYSTFFKNEENKQFYEQSPELQKQFNELFDKQIETVVNGTDPK